MKIKFANVSVDQQFTLTKDSDIIYTKRLPILCDPRQPKNCFTIEHTANRAMPNKKRYWWVDLDTEVFCLLP